MTDEEPTAEPLAEFRRLQGDLAGLAAVTEAEGVWSGRPGWPSWWRPRTPRGDASRQHEAADPVRPRNAARRSGSGHAGSSTSRPNSRSWVSASLPPSAAAWSRVSSSAGPGALLMCPCSARYRRSRSACSGDGCPCLSQTVTVTAAACSGASVLAGQLGAASLPAVQLVIQPALHCAASLEGRRERRGDEGQPGEHGPRNALRRSPVPSRAG